MSELLKATIDKMRENDEPSYAVSLLDKCELIQIAREHDEEISDLQKQNAALQAKAERVKQQLLRAQRYLLASSESNDAGCKVLHEMLNED